MFYFNIDSKLLSLFYQSCVLSILNFCIPAWGGNALKKDTNRINRCLKNACRMIKKDCDTFDDIFLDLCYDKSHPLCDFIKRSPKSGRILHLTATKVRYFNSFLPFAIRHCDNPRSIVLVDF